MSGVLPWHASWLAAVFVIVTATLPPVDVAPPARVCGSGVGAVLVAVKSAARQPTTGVPPEVMLAPEDATEAVVALRLWDPEPGLWTVYARFSVPEPGYSGPPVAGETATVNAVEEPTDALPVPEPVDVKYANAAPAHTSTATTLSPASVRFFRKIRNMDIPPDGAEAYRPIRESNRETFDTRRLRPSR